jgi:outer membrane biosynthesis protein TonB
VDRNGNVADAQVLEGTAVVEFSIDQNNNPVPKPQENSIYSQIAQAALAATRQMKFTPPENGDESTVVLIKINFTVAGTNFNRQTRERSGQNEREPEVK